MSTSTLDDAALQSATHAILDTLHRGGLSEARIEDHGGHPSNVIRFRPFRDAANEFVLTVRVRNRYSSNVVHVRWQEYDADGKPNPTVIYYGLLNETHPAVGCRCCLCPEQLDTSRSVSLRILGADTDNERARQAAGYDFKALAAVGHTSCLRPQMAILRLPNGTI